MQTSTSLTFFTAIYVALGGALAEELMICCRHVRTELYTVNIILTGNVNMTPTTWLILQRFNVWNMGCSLCYNSDYKPVFVFYVYRVVFGHGDEIIWRDNLLYRVRFCTRFDRPCQYEAGKGDWWWNEDVQESITTKKLAKRTLDTDNNEENNAS